MSCDNVKRDFQKRYASQCEKIYFMAKPVTFFEGMGSVIGCGVSTGCYLATEKRQDDRIMLQFSHNDKLITVNTAYLEQGQDKFSPIFLKLKKLGVKVGGARLFFYSNSDIKVSYESLLLMALESFCRDVPPKSELLRHFKEYNLLSEVGKTNYITLIRQGKAEYFPFRKSGYKIILSKIEESKKIKPFDSTKIDDAVECLKKEDYTEFGRLLNTDTERIIEENGLTVTGRLFKTVKMQREALGSGVLENGGLFSIVENKNADSFARNVSREYRRFYGASPRFYITDTENSGVIN